MEARTGFLATLAAFIGGKLRAPTNQARGPTMHWPTNPGWWGNGDRGPLGSWQMNRNAPHRGLDLLAFSAVYGCVNTISQDIAKMPVEVYEIDLEDGAREIRRRDYYTALFRRPNQYQTGPDFIQAFVQSSLLQGNTYCAITKRNGRGEPEELHVLNPYTTKPLITEGGAIFYECAEDFLAGIKPGQEVLGALEIGRASCRERVSECV